MTKSTLRSAFILSVIAPSAALLSTTVSAQPQGLRSIDVAALEARFDPSLATMRAGLVATPATLAPHERDRLGAAQDQSSTLADMRAGAAPTDKEWGWIAIGAAVVLLIILL